MAPTAAGTEAFAAPSCVDVPDVTGAIRSAITGGIYHPNVRLVEEELARTFATNRAVVRTALATLAHEGLVIRERNRGARVREIEADEAIEILEARAALEGIVARRAAERFNIDSQHAMEALIVAMRRHRANGDLVGYSEVNARFHRAILEIAQHAVVKKLLGLLQSQSVRYQFRTVLQPGRIDASLAEHEAIVAALIAKDPDGAEAETRRHIAAVIQTIRMIALTQRSAAFSYRKRESNR